MSQFRVTMHNGTVTITRQVEATDTTSAILAAQDPTGFWSAPLIIDEVSELHED